MARKRVSFSISSDPDTVEGRLVDYLRNSKMLNLREAVIRALKAYYLPWVYEDEVSKEEVKVLARNTIDELEFRIFQIRRHFLAGEPYGPKLGTALGVEEASVRSNGQAAPSTETVLSQVGQAQADATQLQPVSLPQMLDDADIDPDVLDDF